MVNILQQALVKGKENPVKSASTLVAAAAAGLINVNTAIAEDNWEGVRDASGNINWNAVVWAGRDSSEEGSNLLVRGPRGGTDYSIDWERNSHWGGRLGVSPSFAPEWFNFVIQGEQGKTNVDPSIFNVYESIEFDRTAVAGGVEGILNLNDHFFVNAGGVFGREWLDGAIKTKASSGLGATTTDISLDRNFAEAFVGLNAQHESGWYAGVEYAHKWSFGGEDIRATLNTPRVEIRNQLEFPDDSGVVRLKIGKRF